MSFALIRLFLGGALKSVIGWLSHRSFWQLVSMGLAALLLVQHFELVRSRAEAAKWHNQFSAEHSGRIADRQAYRDAQVKAAAQNAAHVETENKLREQINETSRSSFVADRDRLRAQSGTPKGAPGSAAIPSVPKAAPGTPPEVLSLPPAELLSAQETELQLNALIDWVIAQSKVDPNKP